MGIGRSKIYRLRIVGESVGAKISNSRLEDRTGRDLDD